MNTQDLINEALNSERILASCGVKFDWHQFSGSENGIECELHVNGIDDAHARRMGAIQEFKVVRTTFWHGCNRVSRAEAEKILGAK